MDWLKRNFYYLIVLAAAAGEAFDKITLDWVGLVLLLVAGFPTWLPTFARYVKALRKTDKGWEIETREDIIGLPAKQIDKVIEIKAEAITEAGGAERRPPDDYQKLSLHARRVLKALWHYQRDLFGEDSPRRWGFGVGRQAPDFPGYSIGVRELEWDKLVYADPRGLCYLTNEGIAFCKKHRDSLDGEELYFNSFVPAPDA